MAKQKEKKAWFPIYTIKEFGETFLGETFLSDPNNAIGRSLSINLMSLTNNVKKQHTNIGFKIINRENNKLYAEPSAIEVLPSLIKRKVRRSRNKIEHSFKAVSRDRKLVNVKVLIITLNSTNNSVLTRIRKNTIGIIRSIISKNDYLEFFNDVLQRKTQDYIKKRLSRIYPIRDFEIRVLHNLGDAPKEAETPVKTNKAESAPESAKEDAGKEKKEEESRTPEEPEEAKEDAS